MEKTQRPGATHERTGFKLVTTTAICVVLMALVGGLAGCSSNKDPFAGKGSPIYDGPDPIPRGGGAYKVGKPYQIAGRTYYPKEQPGYDKTGMASWYGDRFHKRKTANGEWFDMNALTAAHPTLPLPSYVRVTNLKNNRSLVVRVNDRGPYAHDRIIDMSKRSAQELGFQNDGITKVRVQYLGKAPLQYEDADILTMNAKYRNGGRPNSDLAQNPVPRIQTNALHTGTITPASAPSPGYYVQAGSFSSRELADQLSRKLGPIGNAEVDEQIVGRNTYYRVRVGPMKDEGTAHATLGRVVAAGLPDAHLTTR